MSLRDGLVYSKNTITAQVMQSVGPARVAKLARAMGVRQSRLEEVPSLALGTSPVTLKEMVAAYGTIANEGRYIEPVLVTRIEDRHGKVLEEFEVQSPETAMPTAVAHTLLDVMRGVVDKGTGAAIRSRFGIRADLAGKTGTTQDNTDGWFLLMHPHLVAGAWVGFNDNRVTMGDRWGPGAQSALPMVGEFFAQALRAKVIDQRARFAAPLQAGQPDPTLVPGEVLNGLLNGEPAPGVEPPLESASGAEAGAVQESGGQPVIRYTTVPGPALDAPPDANGLPSVPMPEAPMRGAATPATGEVKEPEGVGQ
jgi:penicillin-binding protein 1A